MGRKVLLAAICWLTLSEAIEEADKTVNSSVIEDNESAESAPRLYQSVPVGVYASAAPHGSYSFPVPAVLGPQPAASQLAAVKTTSVTLPKGLYNLKDSYGRLVALPQTAAYKTAFPQQYVQLQELPPHLAQPLVSASPSLHFKSVPNYFFGPQNFKAPALQIGPATGPVTHFGGQPFVYAENIRSFVPLGSKLTLMPQTTNDVHFENAPTFQRLQEEPQSHAASNFKDTSTFYRLQEKPQSHADLSFKDTKQQASHYDKKKISSPIKTKVPTVVNGKKTVITVDTKPPLPLLDLNLLEPLIFDNPLVPQMQLYLPKISSATYHKLPSYNNYDSKNKQKDVSFTKTKAYDTGYVKAKSESATKKKQNKPRHQKPSKPGITVKGYPNSGDYSYEINTPNHKETYNEQVIKFNKETNMNPVEFSYNEQSHKEPEVYTFLRSSKEPLKVTHVEYKSDNESPKELEYDSPEEQQDEQQEDERQPSSQEAEDSGESSAESEEEGPAPPLHYREAPKPQQNSHHENHEAPKNTQHNKHKGYYNTPIHTEQHSYGGSPKQYHQEHHSEAPRQAPAPQYHAFPTVHSESHKQPQQHYIYFQPMPQQNNPNGNYQKLQDGKFKTFQDQPRPFHFHSGPRVHSESPRQSHHLKAEHRGQVNQLKPNSGIRYEIIQTTPKYSNQPLTVKVQNAYQPITPEYEEDIRLLPNHAPNAHIKVDPNQHLQFGPTIPPTYKFNIHASPGPQILAPRKEKQAIVINSTPRSSSAPHVHEKSKRVIIKEEEETPDERHTRTEQVVGEMIKQEENSEEDFDKAYKESAFGFPAYNDESADDLEKDIYSPESYGVARYHNEYKIEETPFKQFQQDGDKFPKSARLAYKDARDNNKEDYFLEFAVNKPTSYTDRVKNQVDYYKMFKKQRPGREFYENGQDDDGEKDKNNEKYTVAPTFEFFETSSKPKPNQNKHFVQFKAAPIKYEYDYSKEAPRDSVTYATKPHRRTHFVEPQFQYGFEPISAPIIVDSELAAMASNDNLESEKPGTRKKIYKENWYIKKTSTTGSKPS